MLIEKILQFDWINRASYKVLYLPSGHFLMNYFAHRKSGQKMSADDVI